MPTGESNWSSETRIQDLWIIQYGRHWSELEIDFYRFRDECLPVSVRFFVSGLSSTQGKSVLLGGANGHPVWPPRLPALIGFHRFRQECLCILVRFSVDGLHVNSVRPACLDSCREAARVLRVCISWSLFWRTCAWRAPHWYCTPRTGFEVPNLSLKPNQTQLQHTIICNVRFNGPEVRSNQDQL